MRARERRAAWVFRVVRRAVVGRRNGCPQCAGYHSLRIHVVL